jgi:hypothetical protein
MTMYTLRRVWLKGVGITPDACVPIAHRQRVCAWRHRAPDERIVQTDHHHRESQLCPVSIQEGVLDEHRHFLWSCRGEQGKEAAKVAGCEDASVAASHLGKAF